MHSWMTPFVPVSFDDGVLSFENQNGVNEMNAKGPNKLRKMQTRLDKYKKSKVVGLTVIFIS